MAKELGPLRKLIGWRNNCCSCPQPLSADIFSGCQGFCFWCYCSELEQSCLGRYFKDYRRETIRPSLLPDWQRLFDDAQNGKKGDEYDAIRHKVPFGIGSKADAFPHGDKTTEHTALIEGFMKLCIEHQYPVIMFTKTTNAFHPRFLDLMGQMKVAVEMGLGGGDDEFTAWLEPGCPPASQRWEFVQKMNEAGIWTAVKWEPVFIGWKESEPERLERFVYNCVASKTKHVAIYNYRSTVPEIARRQFEERGIDYLEFLKRQSGKEWLEVGATVRNLCVREGVPMSNPDFINFPWDRDRESCCGVDDVLGLPFQMTFQHAIRVIMTKGMVGWADMEGLWAPDWVKERMKMVWNGNKSWYSLNDKTSDGRRLITAVGQDSNGMNIYGRGDGEREGLL